MNSLIERYVYDVVRRLPEKDRDEVSRELTANIRDMMPDDATQDEISAVLLELGRPAKLAEQYRQNPQYLISPAIYDNYVRTLKLVLPIVGIVLLIVGMVLGLLDSIKADSTNAADYISSIISNGISMGVSAAFQTLFWITLGFVIAERSGAKVKEGKESEWTLDKLPEIPTKNQARIPLSDNIAELVVTLVLTFCAIALFSSNIPLNFMLKIDDFQINNIFSPEFLRACIPAIAIAAAFTVTECVIKIVHPKWDLLTCCATVISNLAGMGIWLYMITRSYMFSGEFTAYIKSTEWGKLNILNFAENPAGNPIVIGISVIVITITIVTCLGAIKKTVKASKA